MMSLTNEENEYYEMQKVCYICKKINTDKNDENGFKLYHKARDNCHYTREFGGAAHSICNLRYKTPKTKKNECKCGKDFTKIKFDTDDDLSLNKPLNLHILTIIARSVFEDEVKFYPQVYLDECLYELHV